MEEVYYKDITLLITHFNRSASLKRLLLTISQLGIAFADVVVSDDGSNSEHFAAVKELQQEYAFTLITGSKNKGLGNNINKGQEKVKTKYTLYVQEDFYPTAAFPGVFQDAVKIMENDSAWDLIRFYGYGSYPYLKPYRLGFSEMMIRRWSFKTAKIFIYSDHPHLRRSDFPEKFGRYVEGLKPQKTEYLMTINFLQKKGRALFHENYRGLFVQQNSASEPSTWQKRDWRTSKSLPIVWLRQVYRQLKYNFDWQFQKIK